MDDVARIVLPSDEALQWAIKLTNAEKWQPYGPKPVLEDVKVERTYCAGTIALARIWNALAGITDDYMTSDIHHPDYVLIPVAKFKQLCALLQENPDA